MQSIARSLALLVLIPTTFTAFAQVSTNIQVGKPDRPVIGLPFTADQTIHTVTHLANGLLISREMKGHMFRSADGIERYDGDMPSTDPTHPEPTSMVYILDRVKRTSILLNSRLKTAVRQDLPPIGAVTVNLLPIQVPPQQRQIKTENIVTTDLGKQTVEFLELIGKRVAGTIPAGKIGNDQPLPVLADVWFAPALKIIVRQTDKNPLAGERTFELTNIRRVAPDPQLFEIPDGYKVTDRTAMPTLPAQIQALKESRPPVPEQRTKQIQDALDDPSPANKNNVAYGLAQNGDHLTDAQLLADQAVQLEEQQVAGAISEADAAKSFDQMVALSRTWDTAGYVYFRAHKLDKAEAYQRAAWELNPNSLFAIHLGWIYEAEHKTDAAITVYRMALSAHPSAAIQDGVTTRLVKLGQPNAERLPVDIVTPLTAFTQKIARGDDDPLVDIVLSHNHPPAVTLLKGNAALKQPLTTAVESALASALPDSGPELVIRRARVTCADGATPTCSLHFTNTREFTAEEQARRDALRPPQ